MKYYYLTFNDVPSGVYISQVIDVVHLYNNENINMRLVAFLSFRDFYKNRNVIKGNLSNSIVVPSFPKLKNFKINKWLLRIFIRGNNNVVIARSVFATNLSFEIRDKFSKIIYDGRGAIKSEQEEYGVYNGTGIEKNISEMERRAVIDSDFRISVSEKLVNYWIDSYGYMRGKELVIPCSVNPSFSLNFNDKDYGLLPGLEADDILLIYSGSLAGWQSFKMLSKVIMEFLSKNLKVKILFLSREQDEIAELLEKFPDNVYRRWVEPENVKYYLSLGDYGLIVRENNVTNEVASPVKFAEYLMAGLNVIMTDRIGDYSEFIQYHQCGLILDDKFDYRLTKVSEKQKKYNIELAKIFYSKLSVLIIDAYKKVLYGRKSV